MKVIVSIFILFLVGIFLASQSFARESKFYQLVLAYDKGNIKAKDVIVIPGDISDINSGGDYIVGLISFSNTSLYKTNFDIPTSFHGEEFDYTTGKVTSRQTQLDAVDIVISIPYFQNGKQIDIYDPENKKILTIPVQHFAEITPSPTQAFNPTLAKDSGRGNTLLYIGLGGLGLGIAFTVYLFRQSRRKESSL